MAVSGSTTKPIWQKYYHGAEEVAPDIATTQHSVCYKPRIGYRCQKIVGEVVKVLIKIFGVSAMICNHKF